MQVAESVVLGIFLVVIILYCLSIEVVDKKKSKPKWHILENPRQPAFPASMYSLESRKRPIPGVPFAIAPVSAIGDDLPWAMTPSKEMLATIGTKNLRHPETGEVRALRGGEFIGNRMRFKVKVMNDSQYIIVDVRVYLLSFPKDALRLTGEDDCQFSKIEPKGFRSPTFDFMPTQDCVKGDIIAGVSYVDMKGEAHALITKPFVIRAVCDMLLPDQVTPEEFELKLKSHEHGEIVIKVNEWTPEEMFEKALRLVDESNFFEVSSDVEEVDGIVYAKISGFAKGKYTSKSLGVQINISGPSGIKGASCTLRVSGEDQAMILPAMDDLRERLSAWLCPICSSPLTLENVQSLREGKVVECPFCAVSIER